MQGVANGPEGVYSDSGSYTGTPTAAFTGNDRMGPYPISTARIGPWAGGIDTQLGPYKVGDDNLGPYKVE